MKNLWKNIGSAAKRIESKKLLLLLDYDGTLAPIRKKPQLGVLGRQSRSVLQKLAQLDSIKIALISGRALKDVTKIVGLKNIIYVGSHGLETKSPLLSFKPPVTKKDLFALKAVRSALRKELSSINGILFEDKPYSFSVHYRLVSKNKKASLNKILNQTLSSYVTRKQIKILRGKKVVEIMLPIKWNKGEIVKLFLNSKSFAGFLPIYIGDDATDEFAFKAVRNGISVRVGKKTHSNAAFYVDNTTQVYSLLDFFYESKRFKEQ